MLLGVLSDVQDDMTSGDSSSRDLLQKAESEAQVQEWLSEQVRLRSNGRYHVHRETEVSGGNKPDIVVSATAALAEAAIEVKHGGREKGWSVRRLESALTKQLAENYLKPASRRWGVLVVSHHGNRTWRDPDTRAVLQFRDVIDRLERLAAKTTQNSLGPVGLQVFGIDASLDQG